MMILLISIITDQFLSLMLLQKPLRNVSLISSEFDILMHSQSGLRQNVITAATLLKFTNDVFSFIMMNSQAHLLLVSPKLWTLLIITYSLRKSIQLVCLDRPFFGSMHIFIIDVILLKYHGCQSDYQVMEKGVLQGSTLGPFFFSNLIDVILQICSDCNVHIYADDTVIYNCDSDISQVQSSLQSYFNVLRDQFHNNTLLLNKKKKALSRHVYDQFN